MLIGESVQLWTVCGGKRRIYSSHRVHTTIPIVLFLKPSFSQVQSAANLTLCSAQLSLQSNFILYLAFPSVQASTMSQKSSDKHHTNSPTMSMKRDEESQAVLCLLNDPDCSAVVVEYNPSLPVLSLLYSNQSLPRNISRSALMPSSRPAAVINADNDDHSTVTVAGSIIHPPYMKREDRPDFVTKFEGACHCGTIVYYLACEEPLAAKMCHCMPCQTRHGEFGNLPLVTYLLPSQMWLRGEPI